MGQVERSLAGKVAVVTGSSRGIGAAIARALGALGADVVINYVSSAPAAEAVAADIRGKHDVRAVCVQADVSDEPGVTRLFSTAKEELGRIDIVMSNSGIEHFGDLDKTTGDEIDRVFAVNVKGQYFVSQQAYRHMEDGGRLILISSISAVKGFPRHAVYAASKAAVQGMVKCLAWDFGKRGITVNCIAPGGVKTDMWTEVAAHYVPGGDEMSAEEIEEKISQGSPLGRVGFPDDVAGVVSLLARPESQWLTGQTFHVSGGAQMATA